MTENDSEIIKAKFLSSEEGRIFAFGSTMLIMWCAAIFAFEYYQQPVWGKLIKMALTHVSGGRAASVFYATTQGMSKPLIAFLAVYLDVMVMMIVYPILVFSYKNFLERRWYKKHFKHVFDSALVGVTKFRKYKIAGVFMFVWFPLTMTGIVVGSLLGFLLGLRTWVTMTTVVLGTISAVICWVYASGLISDKLTAIHPWLPQAVAFTIIALLISIRLFKKRS